MDVERQECSKCGGSFPLETFASNGKTVGGTRKFRTWCKLCESNRVSKRNKRRRKTYRYLTANCIDCDKIYRVRLEGDDCSELVAICDDCVEQRNRSQNGKQKEAYQCQ